MKKNYCVVEDGHLSSIEETEEKVNDNNNYYVFNTLAKAKKQLIANMKQDIANLKRSIKRVKSITENDLYGKID